VWLRAAVLGANDGIVSTASLLIGVAAADATRTAVLVAGVAGLAAGALAMAAGEYVSVSSQADTERADLEVERREQAQDSEAEIQELAEIYIGRGVDPPLARQVAQQLMVRDPLGAHARDELGISATGQPRPLQAAFASAAAFAAGAAIPLLTTAAGPEATLSLFVASASLICLAGLGALWPPAPAALHCLPARFVWRSGARLPWPQRPEWGGYVASRSDQERRNGDPALDEATNADMRQHAPQLNHPVVQEYRRTETMRAPVPRVWCDCGFDWKSLGAATEPKSLRVTGWVDVQSTAGAG